VEITAALAADLATLSETLDATDPDIGEGLRQLAADAKLAVRSYLGLTLVASDATFPVTFTAMEDVAHHVRVASSLVLPLSDDSAEDAESRFVVILYAGRPGAFVDLAAELSWLTGRRFLDFALDQHLTLAADPDTGGGVQAASVVNQAIGVLLGRGYTPEQAASEIDTQALAAGHSRFDAAEMILGAPPRSAVDPTLGAV
jgi:hypothetical protein